MTYRPEDRKRLIGLGAAIVLVLGYGVVFIIPRAVGSSHGTPRPAAPTIVPASLPGAQAAVGVPGTAQPTPDKTAVAQDLSVPPPAERDPFEPPVAARPVNRFLAAPHLAPRRPAPPGPSVLPRDTRPKLAAIAPPVPAAAPTTSPTPPEQPVIELKGVVLGQPTIAVLRLDGQIFDKKEKERLRNGWLVEHIAETGVVLKAGTRRITLEVGHAWPPAKAGQETPAPPTVAPAAEPPVASAPVTETP